MNTIKFKLIVRANDLDCLFIWKREGMGRGWEEDGMGMGRGWGGDGEGIHTTCSFSIFFLFFFVFSIHQIYNVVSAIIL